MTQVQESAIKGVTFTTGRAIIDADIIPANQLTEGLVGSLFDLKKDVFYQYSNKNGVNIHLSSGNYAGVGRVDHVTVCGLEYAGEEDDKSGWYVSGSNYFPMDCLTIAIKSFVARITRNATPVELRTEVQTFPESSYFNSAVNHCSIAGMPLESIFIRQSGLVNIKNHYTYLDEMLVGFWQEVFGKHPNDMMCGGIVSAHGDKCDQYRSDWEEQKIPFNRGAMLYLLTYTTEFNNKDKSKSREWVIDNYPKYLPLLEKVEQELMKTKFHVDRDKELSASL